MIKKNNKILTLDEILEITDTGKTDTMQLKIFLPDWITSPSYLFDLVGYIIEISFVETEKVTVWDNKNKEYKDITIYKCSSKYKDYSFHYRSNTKCLFIQLPHHHVLGTDQEIIIRQVKQVMKEHFNITQEYIDKLDDYILLSRIDYKRDYRYHDLEEYSLIREIVDRVATRSIVSDNYKFEVKENTENKYMIAYKSSSNRTVEIVCYNKDKEQLNRYKKKKIDLSTYKSSTNLIRFEVRIKNLKLNSLNYRDGTTKEICNYKNKETADKLFSEYIEKIYFTEPFYRIDVALKKVKENKIRQDVKDNLCNVLVSINEKGYSETRRIYSKSNSKTGKPNYSKFNRYINKLIELKINPLTFSMTWLDEQITTYEQIPNFTLAENCIEEEALII